MDRIKRQERILHNAGFEIITTDDTTTQLIGEGGQLEVLDAGISLTKEEELYADAVATLNQILTEPRIVRLTSADGKSKIALM